MSRIEVSLNFLPAIVLKVDQGIVLVSIFHLHYEENEISLQLKMLRMKLYIYITK